MLELQKLQITSIKIEITNIIRVENKVYRTLPELKGVANIIPSQSTIISFLLLNVSNNSLEIKNIIAIKDNLYKDVFETLKKVSSSTKEEINDLLKKFIEYLHNNDENLAKLAIFNYQFENINLFLMEPKEL